LWWRAPADQTVILQVFGFAYPANSDIRLSGGEEAFYRLHLASTEPPAWRDSVMLDTPVTLPIDFAGTISTAGQEDKIPFQGKKDQYIEAQIESARLGFPLDAWLKVVDPAGAEIARQEDSNGSPDPRLEWKCPGD